MAEKEFTETQHSVDKRDHGVRDLVVWKGEPPGVAVAANKGGGEGVPKRGARKQARPPEAKASADEAAAGAAGEESTAAENPGGIGGPVTQKP